MFIRVITLVVIMPSAKTSKKPDYRKKTYMREHYVRQGLTCSEIGDMNGVSAVTIHNWLLKLDIPVRSRGSRHPLNPKWNDGSADQTVRRCSNCGKAGHNARTCGNEMPVVSPGRRCGNCGEVGHNVRTCVNESVPAGEIVTISTTQVDVDPAIQHLLDLRAKLEKDLDNVNQALEIVRQV